jgi:hypothetical protein
MFVPKSGKTPQLMRYLDHHRGGAYWREWRLPHRAGEWAKGRTATTGLERRSRHTDEQHKILSESCRISGIIYRRTPSRRRRHPAAEELARLV